MYGYRDHCIRKDYQTFPQFYCPYFMYQLSCPYSAYRQRIEEYPVHHHKRPKNPPPSNIPQMPATAGPIEPSTISPCAYKYSYFWLKNGESFWAYIVNVGKRSISGWKYTEGRWKQFGLHLAQIKNFTCS